VNFDAIRQAQHAIVLAAVKNKPPVADGHS
jgi:hypothetical protein